MWAGFTIHVLKEDSYSKFGLNGIPGRLGTRNSYIH